MKVKDLMVHISEYATIPEDASLMEAILALEKAQIEFNRSRYLHRAILVYDRNNKVVGKLSQIDILKAIRSGGDAPGDERRAAWAEPGMLLQSIFDKPGEWDQTLVELCRTMGTRKVGDVMVRPSRHEHVPAEADLYDAIESFINGSHQALLVEKDHQIVGILRLTDVFQKISEIAKACRL